MRPAKRENQKTRKPESGNAFGRFRVFAFSRCSHLRASLIASLIDCNMLLDANTAFLLSPFSGLRVFAVFGFSPFSRFRVFAVFAFSGFRRFRRFRVFAVFGFSRFCVFVFTGWFLPFSRFRVFVLLHVQSWRFRATECTALAHTLHMPKALTTFVFIVLCNGLRRYIFYTCMPKGVKTFVFKVLQKVLLRYITYTCPKAQSCENLRVQSAVLRNGLLRYILLTWPKAWKPSCSKCYKKDCFGTYFTHAQNCHDLRVQRATERTASVHILRMPKPVITFVFILLRNTCPNLRFDNVFKVLRNGLLRYILHTCPKVGKPSCSRC